MIKEPTDKIDTDNDAMNEAKALNLGNVDAILNNAKTTEETIEDTITNLPDAIKNAKFALAFHPKYAVSSKFKTSSDFEKADITKIRSWVEKLAKGSDGEVQKTYKSIIDTSTNTPIGDLQKMIDNTAPVPPDDKTKNNIYARIPTAVAYLVASNPNSSKKTIEMVSKGQKGTAVTRINQIVKDASSQSVGTDSTVSVSTDSGAMTLSINDLIGRLHTVADEAVKKEFGKLSNKLTSWVKNVLTLGLASGDASILNTGIVRQGDKDVFSGGSQTYQIIVIPSGALGKKAVAQKAIKLYLKYFAGEDIEVGLDTIAKQQSGVLGGKTNVWVYPYSISYKKINVPNVSESMKMQFAPESKTAKNVWINENINPFNHKEPIGIPRFDSFIKAVDDGKNVKARQILESNLKKMAKTKFRATEPVD